MRRHLYNLLAAGSLLLCVAVSALWVRSYREADCVTVTRYRCYGFTSWQGKVALSTTTRWVRLRTTEMSEPFSARWKKGNGPGPLMYSTIGRSFGWVRRECWPILGTAFDVSSYVYLPH